MRPTGRGFESFDVGGVTYGDPGAKCRGKIWQTQFLSCVGLCEPQAWWACIDHFIGINDMFQFSFVSQFSSQLCIMSLPWNTYFSRQPQNSGNKITRACKTRKRKVHISLLLNGMRIANDAPITITRSPSSNATIWKIPREISATQSKNAVCAFIKEKCRYFH